MYTSLKHFVMVDMTWSCITYYCTGWLLREVLKPSQTCTGTKTTHDENWDAVWRWSEAESGRFTESKGRESNTVPTTSAWQTCHDDC